MRSVSGEGNAVLPWHVIREDGAGNRYRVGSYASRTEAQQVADRLGKDGAARGLMPAVGADSYLVESIAHGSSGRA